MLTGALACALAVLFYAEKQSPFFFGMALPLALLGLIQLGVGCSVFFRTDRQVAWLEQLFAENKGKFVQKELPRMEAILRNFVVYRWVEIVFVGVGLLLLLLLLNGGTNLWKGFGAGMSVQGGLMLLLDFMAEKRGRKYLDFIKQTETK